jgi:CubicO group peptidase (beta-lactamase class C family)
VGAQDHWPTKQWPTSTPAAVGLNPAALAALDQDFAGGKFGYVDSLLIICHGKVVYKRTYPHDYDRIYGGRRWLNQDPAGPYNYFNPDWHPYYRRGDLHTMQSVTKTVTSVLIGVAMARREFPDLDTPVLQFFDATKVANLDDRKRRITLRHLLTMTAGLEWNEDVSYGDPKNDSDRMEASADWVQFVFDRPMAHEPGTIFAYSSGVAQLLSHIFQKATGKDIEEYAAQHLFEPLGIKLYYWKRSPTGLIDTEGGLYLRPEDLAKIGYLFLKNGVWHGKQILRAEWIKASVAPSVTSTGRPVPKYGFLWWLAPFSAPDRLVWVASGFGGQRLIVVPEHDLIVVITGWTIEPQQAELSRWLTRVVLDRLLSAVVRQSH